MTVSLGPHFYGDSIAPLHDYMHTFMITRVVTPPMTGPDSYGDSCGSLCESETLLSTHDSFSMRLPWAPLRIRHSAINA